MSHAVCEKQHQPLKQYDPAHQRNQHDRPAMSGLRESFEQQFEATHTRQPENGHEQRLPECISETLQDQGEQQQHSDPVTNRNQVFHHRHCPSADGATPTWLSPVKIQKNGGFRNPKYQYEGYDTPPKGYDIAFRGPDCYLCNRSWKAFP